MFKSESIQKDDEIYKKIYGKSYQKNPFISLEDLRYITVKYIDFDNQEKIGHLIVNKLIAKDVIYIFKKLYEYKYQIFSINLIDEYWKDNSLETDKESMKHNNSSCFNYRQIDGKDYLSYHALGLAIDINPINNPYIINRNGNLDYSSLSEEELFYTNERECKEHAINKDDFIYRLFKERGFEWGGDWNPKTQSIDYQHFEKPVISNKKLEKEKKI